VENPKFKSAVLVYRTYDKCWSS